MDLINLVQYIAALVLVLALILCLAWLVRRSGFAPVARAPKGRRRLELLEVLPLDPKRRLVLVRCDQQAHLLLLGIDGDLVVQSGIDSPRFEITPPAPPPSENPA